MREIYEDKKLNWHIQQGTIFNNCIAESYCENVSGIIITPRCDIDNNKVKTLHYLPIVTFEDWVRSDLLKLFQQDVKNNTRGQLTKTCKDYNISTTLLSNSIDKNAISKIFEAKICKPKELKRANDLLHRYHKIDDASNIIDFCKTDKNILDNIIQNLQRGQYKDFYLIEDWTNDQSYRVILLREVNRITIELGQKISTGLTEAEITKDELSNNDISVTENRDSIMLIEAKIKSPFIEHIIQSFFHNFGRIGVDDLDSNNLLINNAHKSLKI